MVLCLLKRKRQGSYSWQGAVCTNRGSATLYEQGQDTETHSTRKQLFDKVHGGMFGSHLREAKIFGELAKRYWWPHMRSQVVRWCQACVI